MSTPELVPPARVEALVRGAAPDDAAELALAALIGELRGDRRPASAAMHERVRALGEQRPPPRAAWRLRGRLIPVAAGCALACAAVLGVFAAGSLRPHSSEGDRLAGGAATTAVAGTQTAVIGGSGSAAPNAELESAQKSIQAAAIPASANRLQEYDAQLRVHVRDADALSLAVNRAMRATRGYGGYIVSADYGTASADDGSARLVVRIPIARIQDAVVRLSALGTLLDQRVRVVDLQRLADQQDSRIAALTARIRRLEARLLDPALAGEERDRAEARLVASASAREAAERNRRVTARRASMALVTLALTTEGASPAAAAQPPGDLERALRDAAGALAVIGVAAIYAAIVGLPLALLGVLAWLGVRGLRRRAQLRLLERA